MEKELVEKMEELKKICKETVACGTNIFNVLESRTKLFISDFNNRLESSQNPQAQIHFRTKEAIK